jgi:DNA-directed RNA polymerase specialized sigma24 family protein
MENRNCPVPKRRIERLDAPPYYEIMSSRRKNLIQLSGYWGKHLHDLLVEIREKRAELDASDSERTNRWFKEQLALKIQEDKLLALLYADGGESMQQIAKLLGHSKSSVQEWIERFRDGCQNKMGSDVLVLTCAGNR